MYIHVPQLLAKASLVPAGLAIAAVLGGLVVLIVLGRRGRVVAEGGVVRACPECGYDLRVTPRRCPECGVLIVRARHYRQALFSAAEDGPAPEELPAAEPTVLLLRTEDPTEADFLCRYLAARGVRTRVDERPGMGMDVFGGPRSAFEIRVRPGDERAARTLWWEAHGLDAAEIEEVLGGGARVVVVAGA